MDLSDAPSFWTRFRCVLLGGHHIAGTTRSMQWCLSCGWSPRRKRGGS